MIGAPTFANPRGSRGCVALRFGMTFLRQDNWDRVVEQVERYEAMGLDSAWVADHFVFPWDPTGPWLEAWSLLGGLAARTHRIQLGTMVSHVIYRNPAVLARTAMTVDRISNGRLQLGLETGASEYDWRLTGSVAPLPFAERVDRFVEAIEIVDGLLRGTMTTLTRAAVTGFRTRSWRLHLIYSRPYSPEGRGNQKRLNRLVRERFLTEAEARGMVPGPHRSRPMRMRSGVLSFAWVSAGGGS
jgi:alkanesulfonate monooxygenase SsuD/methylene tetrahydromethanopterin reductase-like flavin-dependent oxidoreductase (luciferase family)